MLGSWTWKYIFLLWKWADFVSFHELHWSVHGSFGFLTLCAEEERSNSWQKLFQLSQLSVTSSLTLCHLRNDETSTCREMIHPLVDMCPFSDQIRQVVAWWEGLRLFQSLLGFGWPAHVLSFCWDLCLGWPDLAGLCRQACLGLVNLTKWVVLPWVMHMSFHKSCKRDISWIIIFFHEMGI